MEMMPCPERRCHEGQIYDTCGTCDGAKGKWKDTRCTKEYTNPNDCPICHGTGTYKEWYDCSECDGKGVVKLGTCTTCGGSGEVPAPPSERDDRDRSESEPESVDSD